MVCLASSTISNLRSDCDSCSVHSSIVCIDLAWVADVLSGHFHICAGDAAHVRHTDHKLDVSERYLLFTSIPCTPVDKAG